MTLYDDASTLYDDTGTLYDDTGAGGGGDPNLKNVRFICNMGTGMMRVLVPLALVWGSWLL